MKENNNVNEYFPFVPVSSIFIEKYMIGTNAHFVVIYLYILKKYLNKEKINLNIISEKLDILESDIIKALNYWNDINVISYDKTNMNEININFLDLKESQINNIIPEQKKLSYTDDEISIYSQKEEIQQLFRVAEKKLAKTLSYQDRKILITLYDSYGISMEILAILFTYCMEKGKCNFNYIEKVAIDWCENNIDSVEKVEAYLKVFDTGYKNIMRAFGLRREPIKEEINFMKIWLMEYKMPINIIEEACTRTVLKTGQPNFVYTNGIIKNWKDNNVKSIDDIRKIDDKFEQNRKVKDNEMKIKLENFNKQNLNNNFNNKSKFVNYKQKIPNYEDLRKLEIMALKEGIE